MTVSTEQRSLPDRVIAKLKHENLFEPALVALATFAATTVAVIAAAVAGAPASVGLGLTIPLMMLAGLVLGVVVAGSWMIFAAIDPPETDLAFQVIFGVCGAGIAYTAVFLNYPATVSVVGFATVLAAWAAVFMALVVTPWFDRGITVGTERIYG